MELLGKCEAQYANNLLASKRVVLRTDRNRGDNPFIEFYLNETEKNVIIRIFNTVHIEDMKSNPTQGSKNRTDIHFNDVQIDPIIETLSPFINSLSITFDDVPRNTPDPTGMEYPGGLPLGEIKKSITEIPARIFANYADRGFSVRATKIYIDAEKYKENRFKFHIGAGMGKNILDKVDDINSFKLYINYCQLKRFLHSMNIAKKLFV